MSSAKNWYYLQQMKISRATTRAQKQRAHFEIVCSVEGRISDLICFFSVISLRRVLNLATAAMTHYSYSANVFILILVQCIFVRQ
jgi:hypothetical protein